VPTGITEITLGQARRLAIAAQGLQSARPSARITRRHLRGVVQRIGLLQIDSVSTVVRAHYLPLWSRLGSYDRSLLEGMYGELFEYWAHEASLLPVTEQPLFRWRMERAAAGQGIYAGLVKFAREQESFIGTVLDRVTDDGPLAASDLGERGAGGWWGWSPTKRAMEWLFWTGQVAVSGRRTSFERVYDLPERVLPAAVLNAPTPSAHEAHRELILLSAGALGVATEGDLRDYFRLPVADTAAAIRDLVAGGELAGVRVRGWQKEAYLLPGTTLPRRGAPGTLLAPFDPLVWHRPRVERLWDLILRLEIYTPAAKRIHGYYVLPFLLGDRIVARVDLKTDRALGVLQVHAAHAEPGVDVEATCHALARELQQMAGWLGVGSVVVGSGGDLAAALRGHVQALNSGQVAPSG
jgi:uncharacterized protein YcaQ